MAQPTPYERQFAFSGQPKATWAEGLENELNAVKVTSDETLDNLELIQRDDGKLRNGIVTRDSLAPDLALAGLVALDFADEATAAAAEADNIAMSPLGVKQQIDARLADGTTPDTDGEKLSTPADVARRVQANVFPTRAELLARNLPAVQTRVRTSGRDVPGVGGGEFYETLDALSAAGFTLPDGRKFEISPTAANVMQFGALGDGSTDDAAAINSLIARVRDLGGGDVFFPAGTYALSATSLLLLHNVRLVARRGAIIKLANAANIHTIRVEDGASKWGIVGLEIDGNKANQSVGVHGITATGSLVSDGVIHDCYIHDCKTDGIGWAATEQSGIIVSDCHVDDNGGAGISSRTGTISHSTFIGNVARRNGTHNIGATGIASFLAIVGNSCEDAGIADNITAYNDAGNNIAAVGNVCLGGGNNGIHFGGKRLIISSNAVESPAQHGIVARGDSLGCEDAVVGLNTILTPGKSGIWFDNVTGGAIGKNAIRGATNHGMLLNSSFGVAAGDNAIRACVQNGIRTTTSGSDHVFTGNAITDCGADGLRLADVTDCIAEANRCARNTGLGILESGAADYNLIVNNNLRGNSNSLGVVTVGANTVSTPNLSAGTRTVASAATITIPAHTNFIALSGTTSVTSITASWADRVIYIRATSGPVTLTDGGNLKLGGNVVLSANDVVALICEGINWYQISPASDN